MGTRPAFAANEGSVRQGRSLCNFPPEPLRFQPLTARPQTTFLRAIIKLPMSLELEASSQQVQRILQSNVFRTSEVHRNLLQYLADKSLNGDSDSLKEYTVGLDVFQKPESYDPRQESTVRMHVARLRQKLAEYYRTEGADDPIIVELPKGGFRVTFETREVPEVPAAVPAEPRGVSIPWHEVALAAALVLAIGLAFYYGNRLRQVEQQANEVSAPGSSWTPELQALWEPLVSDNRPLIVAVSAVGADSGMFRLGSFLGQNPNVQVLESNQIEAPEVAMGNVVFLGPTTGNRQMQAMSADRPLVLEEGGIRVLNPGAGESEFYPDVLPADPQDSEESYALISRVPGLYGDGEVLYISGNRVSSVTGGVQALTDPEFARTLVNALETSTGDIPRYYQAILKIVSMDDMPIAQSYVLHRELNPASHEGAQH